MSRVRRLLVLLLAWLLLCAPWLAAAQGNYEHPETRLVFPARLADFEFSGVRMHDDPKLGVQVSYVIKGLGSADFYIYNYGEKAIPSGIASDLVHSAYRSADRDISILADSRRYLDLERLFPLGRVLKPADDKPEFYVEAYRFRPGRDNAEPVMSWLLVTGLRNNFLKIRYSYAAGEGDKGRRELGRLLGAFFEANKN